MPHRLIAAALILLTAPAAEAADSWGLENEKPLELRGKVVDLLCELAGDCPAGCAKASASSAS